METYFLISTLMWGDVQGPRIIQPQQDLQTCVEAANKLNWEIPDEMPVGIVVHQCIERAKSI